MIKTQGWALPWGPRAEDPALPLQGAQAPSSVLVENEDPICCEAQPKEKILFTLPREKEKQLDKGGNSPPNTSIPRKLQGSVLLP